jgi:hypothetical protein
MELVKDKTSFVEEITKLTSLNEFIETIFVDEPKGTLSFSKTIATENGIKNLNKEIDYKLKSTRLTIKSCKLFDGKIMISDLIKEDNTIGIGKSKCECITKNVGNMFSLEFSNFTDLNIQTFNLFKQNIIKKVFNPNTEEKLYKKIVGMSEGKSWILIPENLTYLFESRENFTKMDRIQRKLIFPIGKLGETIIYVNSEEVLKVYFGNYDSITLILGKELKIENIKSIQEHYQDVTRITIDYQFIQNEQISCLQIS